jgi:hypothetical protein
MSDIASLLPGAPGVPGSKQSAAALYGLSPGAPRPKTGSGHSLPPTSHTGGDLGMVPWSPDSPVFWFVLIAGTTVLGITGASVRVRAFKRRASVDIGDA